jgi:putative membrane protein
VSARFLDDEARAAFTRAIEAIEAGSAVEVVVAVRRRSYHYRHVNTAIGILVAFAGLAAMLFASYTFALTSILIDPFVVGLAAGALVELLPGVKRVLTPHAHRRMHVHRAARATFVERGVHATHERTGLLVYISWLEQEVALIPDLGLARELPPDDLARMEKVLTAEMRFGGARVAAALERIADEMRATMPVGEHDLNELSNSIDSDLARSRRLFRMGRRPPEGGGDGESTP